MAPPGLAKALGAAVLLRAPLAAEAGRILAHAASNSTALDVPNAGLAGWTSAVAGTKFAEVQSGFAEHWDVLNHYVGHKHVMTFVDFWTIFFNVQKVLDVQEQKRTVTSFLITGEIFTSLEALMEIDRVFTKNLGILTDGGKHWNCSQYSTYNRPSLEFTAKGFFPGSTFQSYNMEMEKECLSELKNSMYFVRYGVCALEKQAEKWTKTMADDVKILDFWKDLLQYNTRKVCRGAALNRDLLSSHLQQKIVDQKRATCVKHDGAVDQCSAECARITECAAVSLVPQSGTCCFLAANVATRLRSKLADRMRPGGESCMQLAGRERFLMLTADGAGDWLERRGFGELTQPSKSFGGKGLTGMVLSFMTEPMLAKWLSTKEARARELRCRIDAELNNDPEADCSDKGPSVGRRLWDAFMSQRARIDNALVAPKGAQGRWRSLKWVLDFTRRTAPIKEAVAWSNTFYEIVAVALHAQKVADLVQDGYSSLKPMVMIKAAVSVTGIFKFKESTAFHKCEQVKSYLTPVVKQLTLQSMDTSSQKEFVATQVAQGS